MILNILCFVLACCICFIYINYAFYKFSYVVSIEFIIEDRKRRLLRIKANKEFQLFRLKEKNLDKDQELIEKLENDIVIIVSQLADLDRHKNVKEG